MVVFGQCELVNSFNDVQMYGSLIQDYEDSYSRPPTVTNAVTYNLNKCKGKVIVPYYKLLSLIAWRPFGKRVECASWFVGICNFLYTFFCFCVLFFWYYIRLRTCQGHLNIDNEPLVTLSPPLHSVPYDMKHIHSHDANEVGNVCQHLIGTYVIPGLMHFVAFIIGFYHFRVKEHEGLYALMEKVYLQSSYPCKMTRTLRIFLVGGLLWLGLCLANSIFYFYAYGTKVATRIEDPRCLVYVKIGLIVWSEVFANCVYVAVVLSYCGQCQLLQYYIAGVKGRLEEKSTELKTAMKEVLDIKCHFSHLNGMLSISVSCLTFDLFITVIITAIMLLTYKKMLLIMLVYRLAVFIQYGIVLIFLLYQAAASTSVSGELREIALAIRVFGYQSHTYEEIDSFLNFLNMVKLEAKIFTMPVKPCYLWGFLCVSVQTLIIAFQTGLIVNDNKWL